MIDKEFNTKFDDFIRSNIGRIEEECPSDNFVNNVMVSCQKYEEVKAARVLAIKKFSLALIPLTIIGIIVFVPGLSGLLWNIISNITLMGILKYYTFTSGLFLISVYILLTERIVKFIRKRSQQSPLLPLETTQ